MRGKEKDSDTFSARDLLVLIRTADAILLQQALVPGKSSPAHSYHDDGEILSFFLLQNSENKWAKAAFLHGDADLSHYLLWF